MRVGVLGTRGRVHAPWVRKGLAFFFAETLLKLLFNGYLTLSTPRNI
jgi:hypothetical protein